MTIQELRDKRTKLLLDAKAIMETGTATAEQRSQVDAMYADANNLKSDIERLQSIEEETRSTSARAIPRDNPEAASGDTRSIEERRIATGKALRNFIQGKSFEQRDLTVGSNGSVTIPVGVTDPVVARKFAGSVYDLVGKLRTSTGEAVKVPFLNDTSQGFVLNSASITTTDPSISGVTISIDDIRMNPILIENSLIQDVAFDILGFVEKNAQTRYLRTVSNWITGGNTSNVGALTGISAGVTSNTTLVTKYVDFTSLLTALDPAYTANAVWVMNNTTLGQVMNIVDSQNRPIFLAFNDGGNSGFVGTLLGYPVKINPYQPSVGVGNVYIQFGDFSEGYTFREVEQGAGSVIALRQTDQRYVELNKLGVVGFARVGGAVTDAGTHPIVSLTGK